MPGFPVKSRGARSIAWNSPLVGKAHAAATWSFARFQLNPWPIVVAGAEAGVTFAPGGRALRPLSHVPPRSVAPTSIRRWTSCRDTSSGGPVVVLLEGEHSKEKPTVASFVRGRLRVRRPPFSDCGPNSVPTQQEAGLTPRIV
jgi:hypothetical protein